MRFSSHAVLHPLLSQALGLTFCGAKNFGQVHSALITPYELFISL